LAILSAEPKEKPSLKKKLKEAVAKLEKLLKRKISLGKKKDKAEIKITLGNVKKNEAKLKKVLKDILANRKK
jgi:hypothetical protein